MFLLNNEKKIKPEEPGEEKMGMTSTGNDNYQTLQSQQSHFVYIVECANGALYTGYTTNVARRIAIHNAGKGAKYTRAHLPVTLLVSWSFSSKRDALRAERTIKRLPRSQKVLLIEQNLQSGTLALE